MRRKAAAEVRPVSNLIIKNCCCKIVVILIDDCLKMYSKMCNYEESHSKFANLKLESLVVLSTREPLSKKRNLMFRDVDSGEASGNFPIH